MLFSGREQKECDLFAGRAPLVMRTRSSSFLGLGLSLLLPLSLVACTEIVVPGPSPTPAASSSPNGDPSVPAPTPLPSGSTPPSPTSIPPAPKADVRVSTSKGTAHYRLGSVSSTRGKELVVYTSTFENRSAFDLPLTLAKLTLETKTGERIPVQAGATKLTAKPCGEVAVLRAGASVECTVAFDVAQDVATRLQFQAQNDYVASGSVPPITRCHDLAHVAQPVANISVSTSLPAAGGTLPADGTYVAEARFSRSPMTDTYPSFTLRVRGGVADETYGLEGTVLQMRYALSAEADFARLELGCVSPAYDEAQATARTVFYWDSSAQMLYMAVGGPDTWLGLRKRP